MAISVVYQGFVGIDIAAKTFTAAWTNTPRSRPQTFDQTTAGHHALDQQLRAAGLHPPTVLVVMEATGSYWVALAVALHVAGYHVAVINPAQIANFAKSLTRHAKTDALDAALILQFARERQPAPWAPPPTVYHDLRQRLVARDALLEMRQQVRNQQHTLAQWPIQVASVLAQFQGIIADLDERITHLEREIAQTLQAGDWAESAALLASIPGIGLVTTAWLLVATLNFQLCQTAESTVAYAALAPLDYQSGTSVHGRSRIGRGGHARLRKAVYLAALSATRHNPLIRTFYLRLQGAGKPFKVAQCAAARKLIHIAWAVVTKGQPFDAGHQSPARE